MNIDYIKSTLNDELKKSLKQRYLEYELESDGTIINIQHFIIINSLAYNHEWLSTMSPINHKHSIMHELIMNNMKVTMAIMNLYINQPLNEAQLLYASLIEDE